jgi:arylsulfatase A-like enzyme
MPKKRIKYAKDLYDSAIFYTDRLVGGFFDKLRTLGIYDDTWIIITSDHGEGFGENHNNGRIRSWQHGKSLYDDQVHVPLIIKPPKGLLTRDNLGRKIDIPAETVDIAPTLMSILSLKPHEQFQGKSLAPILRDPSSNLNGVKFSEDLRNRLFSVISNHYKLIATPDPNFFISGNYLLELYNLEEDLEENKNLQNREKYAPILAELRSLLNPHLENLPPIGTISSDADRKTSDSEKDAEHIERLKELGYL